MALTVRTVADPREWREALLDRMIPRARVWRPDPVAARQHAEAEVDRVLDSSEVWELLDGERACGHLWFGVERGDLVVYDVVVGAPGAVAGVRERVLREARARRLAGVQASCDPDDVERTEFVADPGFQRVATNMLLDLTARSGALDSRVTLTPMTAEEFSVFRAGEVELYAAERHAAGEPLEVALEVSRQQLAELLPDGLASVRQHLFTAREASDPVGILWLGTERPVVFVYDIVIAPELRGRGLGAAVLRAAADWARDRGAPAIGLNVFGPNTTARALYDGLGYQVVEDYFRASLT